MENSIKIIAMAFLIGTAGFQSCTKEKQEEIAYNIAENYINKGKWKVSSFREGDKDETNHFEGYVFQFNTNNTVTATKGSTVVKGTWSTSSGGSKSKFNISFPTAPLNGLNAEWILKNGSASSLELEHSSNGIGGTDYLVFQKI